MPRIFPSPTFAGVAAAALAAAVSVHAQAPTVRVSPVPPGGRSAAAQPASPGPVVTALTPQMAEQVLDEVVQAVEENYVDAQKKPAVLAALAQGRRSGRYAVTDPHEFARRLSDDLRRSSDDGHMYINWKPQEVRARMGGAPGAAAGPDPRAFMAQQTRRANHGLEEMRVLPGNVRYLRVSQWRWDREASRAAYEAAMRFLAEGDAIIVDIRGNGGGTPVGGQYFVSHFVPADTLLMTFRQGSRVREDKAVADLPAGRLNGKPVYVLIDGGAASASEEFALHIDRFKIGELVGETTAGAGHSNSLFGIEPGFELSVSTTLAQHGTDGSNWQGTGVKPHVPAPTRTALDVAHRRALEKLAQTGPEAHRAEYAWAAEGLRLAAQAPAGPVQLARYAGTYEDANVTVRDGGLFFQAGDGPRSPLRLLGGETFAIGMGGGGSRLRFEGGAGGVTGVTTLRPDGSTTARRRTGSAA